jgi:antitoxin VapB
VLSRAGEDDAHGRVERRQHLRSGGRLPTWVRIVVALVWDVGEIPVLVDADQLMLLRLVEKEAVGRLTLPLSPRNLFQGGRELGVSPGRHAEAVPEPFGDREPGHHECGAVCALLEAADGLVEENAVDLGVPELRLQRDKVTMRLVHAAVRVGSFACHLRMVTHQSDTRPLYIMRQITCIGGAGHSWRASLVIDSLHLICYLSTMAMNIKDPQTEALAAEVATLANETKTQAVRTALQERKERLQARERRHARAQRVDRFLEDEAWPQIADAVLGRSISKGERETILGYGPEGV